MQCSVISERLGSDEQEDRFPEEPRSRRSVDGFGRFGTLSAPEGARS